MHISGRKQCCSICLQNWVHGTYSQSNNLKNHSVLNVHHDTLGWARTLVKTKNCRNLKELNWKITKPALRYFTLNSQCAACGAVAVGAAQLSRTWVCCGSSRLRSCNEGWPAASRDPSGASSTRAWSSIRRSPATSLRAPQPEFPALPLGTTGRRRTPWKNIVPMKEILTTLRCGWRLYPPAVDVQVAEDDARSVASEEFEAALRVLDGAHAQDAHEQVEALHEEGSEDRSLKGERLSRFSLSRCRNEVACMRAYLSYRCLLKMRSWTTYNAVNMLKAQIAKNYHGLKNSTCIR